MRVGVLLRFNSICKLAASPLFFYGHLSEHITLSGGLPSVRIPALFSAASEATVGTIHTLLMVITRVSKTYMAAL